MGTFFITFDASSVYATDAPVLEVLVGGVVVSSITIDSGFSLSSYSIEFAGAYPSTLSFRFNDGSAEGGRSITINNAYINGTNINANLSQTSLNQNDSANVDTVATSSLYGETELLLSDLGTVTMQGDADKNKLYGDTGVDVIDGAEDNDNIKGFDGDDRVFGGDGNDNIRGGNGNDILLGGNDNDLLRGEDGNDEIYGGNGNDNLQGGAGDDILNGGEGNDVLRGDIGADTLFGGAGNDILKGEDGNDVLIGGAGLDAVEGGEGDDLLSGGDDNDTVRGGNGNDTLAGDAGNDRVFGEDGDDVLFGGSGNDLLEGGNGADTIDGGTGLDLVRGGEGDDILDGGDDNDQVYGEAGNDTIYGGAGWDKVDGGEGNDTIHGGADNDTVLGGAGIDYVYGDDGHDRVRGGDDNDFVYGGEGNDHLFGDAGDDQVWGGNGNDHINGNEGDDILYGESGLDKMFGHEGNDTIHGGDDNDRIYGNEGDDIINGDDGNDVLYASSEHEIVTVTNTVTANILTEDFSVDSGIFTYSDGGFGGSDPGGPNNIYGQYYTGAGGGSVFVYNNAPNNNTRTNVSGAWNGTFTVDADSTNVELSLDYWLYHAAANDTNEDAQVYVEIDGTQYGLNGDNFIVEALGSGGETNTGGFVTVTLNIADLAAGNHTISMGLFKTRHNRSDEDSYVIFDNVNITGDQEEVYNGLKIMDEGSINTVNGGAGADTIYGSSGNDTLNGGTGNDAIHSGTTASLSGIISQILADNAGVVYNEATGSFYQYVTNNISHTGAMSAANSSTLTGLDGVNGTLAIITSAAEQTFIGSLVNGGDWAWVDGSDSVSEGTFVYESGSEAGNNLDGSLTWYNGSPAATNQASRDNVILWDGGGDVLYAWADGSNARGYVIEWSASTLIDSIGTNTLNGGEGADDLYGSAGTDIFVFDNTNDVDDIFNFDTSHGDVIDIADVLSYNSASDVLATFVQLSENGGNTEIAVDADGLANGSNFTTIASIDGVTGLDLNTLVASGNLIVE